MKLLKDILYKSPIIEVRGSTNIAITSISMDSRQVEKHSLFVAVKGSSSDGHKFIKTAIENGAIAIVCEDMPENTDESITFIKVKNSSLSLGFIACNFYDQPSEKLKLVGITGTNGKTTTATLLFQLFRALGYNVGLISTVQNQINNEIIPSTHTTPDAIKLNELLSLMLEKGCTHVFMEVSSHSLVQHRVAGISFAGAVFSNLTHDHLDYHKTFEDYRDAKKMLFDGLNDDAFALINNDDRNGMFMLQNCRGLKRTYSQKSVSDFKIKILENDFNGLLLNIDGKDMWSKLIGSFNAYNILAVYATAVLLKEDKTNVLTCLSNLSSVEGRFQYIRSENGITGIVDYAHTPDALKNVLNTIIDIRTGNENVITIVGCGGDRDPYKRPEMARIACEQSDKVIITSDNPRSEDPQSIIDQMLSGVDNTMRKKVVTISDRREAIRTGVMMAQSGDIVLIAGKGHEKYQEIKGVKYPFDDMEILKEVFTNSQ